MTIPLRTAIPKRAINPTDAGTERYSPLINSEMIPPVIAKGILSKMSSVLLTERNVKKRIKKITTILTGTTVARRAEERC
jgi:hypothetical protein